MHLNALDIMYNLSIWGKIENAKNFLHIRHFIIEIFPVS